LFIDTFSFRSPGKIGPFDLDNLDGYPKVFMRDVLIHEAHRHPYLELLGTMYLYKIRYAESFGKTAGSCWRLLLVYGLMPWLHQYRIQTRSRLDEAVLRSDVDSTTFGSEGAGETRTLVTNTKILMGRGGGTDRSSVSPWGGGLGQTVVSLGQPSSRHVRPEEEEKYKDEIKWLKEENAELRKLKKEMVEFEKLKKQHAELEGVLAALEQPSVERQPRPWTPPPARTTESIRSQRESGKSSRSSGEKSARLEP
jgi:hypothetical protein